MKKKNKIFLTLIFLFLSACASTGGGKTGAASPALTPELKVASTPGRLRAKIAFKNTGTKEIVINDLHSKNFKVQMADGKPMTFRGSGVAGEVLTVKPGQTVEAAFSLQDSYPFWDRRTKYKIWYEAPGLKTNTVQVWF